MARSFGAADRKDCRHSLISALWLSLMLDSGGDGGVLAFLPLLERLGIDPGVLRETRPYLTTLTWSAPPLIRLLRPSQIPAGDRRRQAGDARAGCLRI